MFVPCISNNTQIINLSPLGNSMISESEAISFISQVLFQGPDGDSELISLILQIFPPVTSMDFSSQLEPEPESELRSLITQTISVFNSMNLDPPPKPLQELISLLYDYSINSKIFWRLHFHLMSLFRKISNLEPEPVLLSLFTQLLFLDWGWDPKALLVITQIISSVSSIDLNSQPKPESELMSLITQLISLFNSIDLDTQPEALSELIILFYANYMDPDSSWQLEFKFALLFSKILTLKPKPDLVSLIHKIFKVVVSMNSKSGKYISMYPQVGVTLRKGKFYVSEKEKWTGFGNWECFPGKLLKFKFPGEDATYFACVGCKGMDHEEYNNGTVDIQIYLHRNHSLQPVWFDKNSRTRECYCCDEDLEGLFSCCILCDFAMNNACVKKPPVLYMDHPKWHEHTLSLFSRQAFLSCNLCGLADAISPIYMCPPCDFFLHQKCINLPRVIRISRHHHRISFTSSFDKGDLSCGVCRGNIDTNYGGYSCIKEGCLYAVHSRCATQKNVWDGIELEEEPEEEEEIEEVEPFVRISDGIIQHHII